MRFFFLFFLFLEQVGVVEQVPVALQPSRHSLVELAINESSIELLIDEAFLLLHLNY